jgi:hypothetical protein
VRGNRDDQYMVEERSNSVEGRSKGLLERLEVRMPVLVAIRKVRILPAENLRIPEEGSSAQGKSGPKARPKGVVDGQQVEIPVPPKIV